MIPSTSQVIKAIRDWIPRNAGDPGINNKAIKTKLAIIPTNEISFLNGETSYLGL